MVTLYLITGPTGVGKTTISNILAKKMDKSALIEGDNIYHQVVGGYKKPWIEGNHLDLFWKICINNIKTYLEEGYDVIFDYIITPSIIEKIKIEFSNYHVKFVVLLANEEKLLSRDKERPTEFQMKERCIVLLNQFKTQNYDKNNIIDTSDLSIEEIVNIIEHQDRFLLPKIEKNKLVFNKNIPELTVSNLEKSLKFYKIVGFKIEYERLENKFVFISLGEIQFMLQEDSGNDKWKLAPLHYPYGNGINFQLEINNLNDIYNNLKNSGYKITYDIEENWYRQDDKLLGNREFLIQDPDGYLLRFSEDLGEKYVKYEIKNEN